MESVENAKKNPGLPAIPAGNPIPMQHVTELVDSRAANTNNSTEAVEYAIDRIVHHKSRGKNVQYRIHWNNFTPRDDVLEQTKQILRSL